MIPPDTPDLAELARAPELCIACKQVPPVPYTAYCEACTVQILPADDVAERLRAWISHHYPEQPRARLINWARAWIAGPAAVSPAALSTLADIADRAEHNTADQHARLQQAVRRWRDLYESMRGQRNMYRLQVKSLKDKQGRTGEPDADHRD